MKSLSSNGGAVVLTAVFALIFLGILFLAYKFNMPSEFKGIVGTQFAGFSGALLLALRSDHKSDSSDNNSGSSPKAQ